jgi:hypothetical protein
MPLDQPKTECSHFSVQLALACRTNLLGTSAHSLHSAFESTSSSVDLAHLRVRQWIIEQVHSSYTCTQSGAMSTKTADLAPRESASIPTDPEPENKSSTY